MNSLDNEKVGANFYNFIKSNSINKSTFINDNFSEISKKIKIF